MPVVSRRAILKSIGLLGLGSAAGLRGLPRALSQDNLPPIPANWQGQPLGRVTGAFQNARVEPSTDADVAIQHVQDDVVRVRRVVQGQTVYRHNDLWLETDQGYLYSSFVQPMWYHLPAPPQPDLGEGRWAEVIVPFTEAYFDPDTGDPNRWVSRMYYGCVFRIIGFETGADGKAWYKVKELYQTFYMRATHLRLIPDEDLAPISPEVDPRDKWLEVDLTRQILVAWEGDKAVYASKIATGLPSHPTPFGTHYIFDKRISERMVGGTAASDDDSDHYNLAGIAFVCYFNVDWVATHGTFWHNDFGQPHSHGCVNLPNTASRWVWRWTTPYATDLNQMYVRPETRLDGTRVEVHY